MRASKNPRLFSNDPSLELFGDEHPRLPGSDQYGRFFAGHLASARADLFGFGGDPTQRPNAAWVAEQLEGR